jgi:hypothetical protein
MRPGNLVLLMFHHTQKIIIMKKIVMALLVASTLFSCAKDKLTGDNSTAAAASASSSSGSGVEDKMAVPPAAVKSAFIAKFGNLVVREWKLRSDGTWKAHFTYNGRAWEATFTAAGTLVKSEPA